MLTLFPILIGVIVIAALHGMILAAFIGLNPKGHGIASRYLALIVLIISLNILGSVYFYTSLFQRIPPLTIIFQSLPFFLGPLFWFYVLALTDPASFDSAPPSRLHFLPGILTILAFCAVFLIPSWRSAFVKSFMERDSWMNPFFSLIYIGFVAIYLALSWQALVRHSRRIRDSFSNIERINLSWLRYLLISFLCFFILLVFIHVIPLPIAVVGEVTVFVVYFFFIAI
jgi:hypothetical protein